MLSRLLSLALSRKHVSASDGATSSCALGQDPGHRQHLLHWPFPALDLHAAALKRIMMCQLKVKAGRGGLTRAD